SISQTPTASPPSWRTTPTPSASMRTHRPRRRRALPSRRAPMCPEAPRSKPLRLRAPAWSPTSAASASRPPPTSPRSSALISSRRAMSMPRTPPPRLLACSSTKTSQSSRG
ncbi:hypothetical protein OC835_007534, partial [Tilletia horrida]